MRLRCLSQAAIGLTRLIAVHVVGIRITFARMSMRITEGVGRYEISIKLLETIMVVLTSAERISLE